MNIQSQIFFSSILDHYRRQEAKDGLKHIGLLFVILNSVYFILCLFLESIWYLSPAVKVVLWWMLSANAVFLFRAISLFMKSFAKHSRSREEALLLHIGQQYPEINDKLLNHYQLSHMNDPISDYAVEAFIEKYPGTFFEQSFKTRPMKNKRDLAVGLVSCSLIVFLFSISASMRIFHMHRSYEPEKKYEINLSPADTSLYTYDSLSLHIQRLAPDRFPVEVYVLDSTMKAPALLFRSRDSVLNYSVGRLQQAATYFARLRRPHFFYPRKFIDSDTLNVTLLQRPRIRTLDFEVQSPEYANIPNVYYQGNIDRISCLNGSKINIDIHLSEELGASYLISEYDTLKLEILDRQGHISWIPENSDNIKLLLVNKNGIALESAPVYKIELEKDAYPVLYLLSPKLQDELLLNEDLQLPYVAHLQDDFGISSFSVNYSIHSEYSLSTDMSIYTIQLPFDNALRLQTRAGVWEIDRFISPGSEIRYYFELSDNNAISGPQTVRSSLFYAKFPSLGDLFARQDEAQEETMAQLEDEVLSTGEIIEELDEIQKQLLQEGELSWENKTALEENLNALEKAREELKNMQSSMDEQKKFMEENALFSDNVMQSFEQLQELMNELIDDELFELMQNIQDKLERNDMSDMEEIMKDFSEKAKRFEESLDRMLAVFKRIQQEQRLEELGQQMKETLQEQEKLLEESEQKSPDELSEQQKKISEDSKDWEKLGRESSELFKDADKEAFEEFIKKMDEADISSLMSDASENYQRSELQEGQQKSWESAERLSSLENDFSQMASKMMQKQKDDVENAFQRAFYKTIYMSYQQEETLEEGNELIIGSPFIHVFTSHENNIMQMALNINDDLLALSKMTFLVDKAIGQALGQVIGNLRSGIQNVEDAKLSLGKDNFNTAYENMNDLGRILFERMNMVQEEQQGNASGMEFYMQQLQQMAGEQQQLNSSMPQPGMSGSPGSMMDQLAKMAARQQALRRSLKQMQQGMSEGSGSAKRMTGDLDRIARDMEDVINQMRKNQVNRQTIMRQEQIVQRLLDASRSATSRDHKKERESTTAKDILRENPLSLPGDLGEHESLINALRREVQNSKLSPQEKRDMERYLESLLEQQEIKGIKK
ncbi:MAG: hypothetical protein K9N05_03355 [Candidatus Marinimicrobia bacterium]|nr:hypothetical protein [Candidatus Neomarinimicrobiota bacterium]